MNVRTKKLENFIENNQSIDLVGFEEAWIREFSLLSSSFFGNASCEEIWKKLGFGYKKIAFFAQKNQVVCYKNKKEEKLFSEYFGKKCQKEKNYAKNISKELISLSDKIIDFLKNNRKLSKSNYNDFYNLYKKFIHYHLAVYWAGDFTKDKNTQSILEKAWVYNEKIYPQIDKYLDKNIKEINRNTSINYSLLRYLTFEELFVFLSNKKLPSLQTLKERQRGTVLFCSKGGSVIYIGKDAIKIKESIKEKTSKEKIKGLSVIKGIVNGKVKVIKDLNDLGKFKPGYILVTPMTRPQFNKVLKKAIAIITDEGGMLCHAAILAREFKIPCIVGTKIATKVLKNEDKVEVNANTGIVRIIK